MGCQAPGSIPFLLTSKSLCPERMNADALHIFFPPAVGVALTIASFAVDHIVAGKLREYLMDRRKVDSGLSAWIVRLAKSIAVLVTYYANVIVLLANCFLAFAVFPSTYIVWLICIGFAVLMVMVLEIAWLSQYDAIDITDDLKRAGLDIGLSLRLEQIVFNVFTIIYFYVGYRMAQAA
jgi:hypothetical protein